MSLTTTTAFLSVALLRSVAHLAHELGADVLDRVLQLHLFGDGHAVVDDLGRPVLSLQHHVTALGAQRHAHHLLPSTGRAMSSHETLCGVKYWFT